MISIFYAAFLAFLIVLVTAPPVIEFLRRLKLGQSIRQQGPKTHLKKAGIPTMGGVLIVASAAVSTLLLAREHVGVLYALLAMLGYSLIGLIDDFIIVVAKRSLGLKARQKLLGQVVLGVLVSLYALSAPGVGSGILVPFTDMVLVLPPWMFLLLAVVVVVGSANAVNLTDGLDGLAAGTTAIAAVAYAIICLGLGEIEMGVFAAAIAGACLGFTWFNAHPAQVFMGDTGSLGLGAGLASLAILTRTELFLFLLGGVFVIETLSVIIQVGFFRVTGGKRIFRMTPLHHHFELSGWPEPKVVFRFWIMALIFAFIGLAGLPAVIR